jgi:hypothetical protein
MRRRGCGRSGRHQYRAVFTAARDFICVDLHGQLRPPASLVDSVPITYQQQIHLQEYKTFT